MKLLPNDIHIRKINGEETVWLSQRLLMDVGGVSEEYTWKIRSKYKKSVRACDIRKQTNFLPDSGKSWRWATLNNEFYYCLDNLPNHAPTYYRSQFGDEKTLIEEWKRQCSEMEISSLETRFKQHLKKTTDEFIQFYKQETPVQMYALAKACTVLDFLFEVYPEYPETSNQLFKDMSVILRAMDLQYIPHHPIRLKEKFLSVSADNPIVEVIKLPRKGNTNAELYNDPEVFSWVMQLRSMDANFSNEYIIRKVTEMCGLTGKSQPSRRWYGSKIFEVPEHQYITGSFRFGSGSVKGQIYKGYLPHLNALYAGDCWEIDATRYNTIAHEVEMVNQETGELKIVEKFMMVVAVRDVHSGDVLGYSFCHAENHVAYHQALKMAVENTGYLPYEIITDRFPGHNTPQMTDLFERMKALGVKVEFSHNPNQKARLERWFRTLQSVFSMDSKYFYGEGIRSRSIYAHRSADYINRIKKEAKKEGWNFDKAADDASMTIEKYRVTALSNYSRLHSKIDKSPAEIHDESEKPNVIWANERRISMLFDLKKELLLRRDGQIYTEIVGVPFHFLVAAEDFNIIADQFNQKVTVSYSLDDLSKVYLWKRHGHLLSYLCDADRFNAPQLYGPNPEYGIVAKYQSRARQIEQKKGEKLQEMVGEEYGMLGPFTQKDKANAFEDWNTSEQSNQLKKASGADITPEELQNTILRNTRNEF